MARLRVVVADDHPLFLYAVAHAVEARGDLELVGRAATGAEALDAIRRERPELAVLDVQMPALDGLGVLQAIVREELPTRVLFLTATLDPSGAYALVEAGAAGVLEKDARPEAIGEALTRIAGGETVLAPSVQAALVSGVQARRAPRVTLSPREHDMLSGLARGLSGPQIAAELHLSPSTVKTHLQRLYDRLGVSDRAAAVAEGMRRGLIE
ncbi:response regulator transcription factor [Candidatus Solirubrobacter pratensis]|uniref:response regulator transcription factor n=1 Tax=Candidatus Solirubrobacter pratensis TaxID=1298857 RepID=UPI00041AB51F|nr:response regulator transcription factor [Candidatus Solirubrobacter pratensis]